MSENGMLKPHWKHIMSQYEECYECSECGLMWSLDEGTPKENEMYYCPKCGSKMDDFVEETEYEIKAS